MNKPKMSDQMIIIYINGYLIMIVIKHILVRKIINHFKFLYLVYKITYFNIGNNSCFNILIFW